MGVCGLAVSSLWSPEMAGRGNSECGSDPVRREREREGGGAQGKERCEAISHSNGGGGTRQGKKM